MKLKPVNVNLDKLPDKIAELMKDADIFDSSSSRDADVLFVDKDCGYFVKFADKGALEIEYIMTKYYNSLNISANVIDYISADKDYLITERINGSDCMSPEYLGNPERLADVLAESLVLLHSIDYSLCPIKNHSVNYLARAEENYKTGNYDSSWFPDSYGYKSSDEARAVIAERSGLLLDDTLIHGDYCLPNIILKDWRLSGFIDVGNGGIGDKHVDIFWALWSLFYNLKTDKYNERFIDAYGREKLNNDVLKLIAAIEVFG